MQNFVHLKGLNRVRLGLSGRGGGGGGGTGGCTNTGTGGATAQNLLFISYSVLQYKVEFQALTKKKK